MSVQFHGDSEVFTGQHEQMWYLPPWVWHWRHQEKLPTFTPSSARPEPKCDSPNYNDVVGGNTLRSHYSRVHLGNIRNAQSKALAKVLFWLGPQGNSISFQFWGTLTSGGQSWGLAWTGVSMGAQICQACKAHPAPVCVRKGIVFAREVSVFRGSLLLVLRFLWEQIGRSFIRPHRQLPWKFLSQSLRKLPAVCAFWRPTSYSCRTQR